MFRIPREEWASELSEFSKRNAGRSTILEILHRRDAQDEALHIQDRSGAMLLALV
jgi:hypothetical protein